MAERGGQPGHRRLSRPAAWAVVAAVAAAAGVAVWALVAQAATSRPWLGPALYDRVFLACAGAAAGCAAALAVLGAALWGVGRAQRRRMDGQQGAAIIEFALALPFALMLTLIMVQSSLLMAGNLCVHYAAFCAARSAAVTVPRPVAPDEGRNVVVEPAASAKLARIRQAAVWAVMPVSAGGANVPEADVETLLAGLEDFFAGYDEPAPLWLRRYVARKMHYADTYTDVELAAPAGRGAYGPHEDLHVTVRHVLYLPVPYARRIFAALGDGVELPFGAGEWGLAVTAGCRMPNEGAQDYVDVEEFPIESG